MSSLLPDMNNHAEKPLIRMPMPATMETVRPATGSGVTSFCTASKAITPQAAISSMPFNSAASIDVPRRP